MNFAQKCKQTAVSQYVMGKARLVGITSWGIDCADYNYPGIYTNVADYLLWITNIIRDGTMADDSKNGRMKKN